MRLVQSWKLEEELRILWRSDKRESWRGGRSKDSAWKISPSWVPSWGRIENRTRWTSGVMLSDVSGSWRRVRPRSTSSRGLATGWGSPPCRRWQCWGPNPRAVERRRGRTRSGRLPSWRTCCCRPGCRSTCRWREWHGIRSSCWTWTRVVGKIPFRCVLREMRGWHREGFCQSTTSCVWSVSRCHMKNIQSEIKHMSCWINLGLINVLRKLNWNLWIQII